jgi:Tfp pilus assembly protein PilV
MATSRRRKTQSGQEMLEFALIALLFIPMLLLAVLTGWGLVRSIQANQVARDLTNIYIHGGDFSTYSMQQLAQRLAQGLNLQIGSTFTGNNTANTSNAGDGVVTVTQIMYVGPTTAPNCVAVGAGNCTNHDSFVFTQRMQFGNGSLTTLTQLGNPTTTAISSQGIVQSPVTDSGAKLPTSGQTNMTNLWQVSGSGRAPLQDGQVIYIVEVFFRNTVNLGAYPGDGVYAVYYF